MRVLVTGGAGYIGSVVTEQLIAAGHDVVVFDNLYQGHRLAVDPRARFIRGDLADRASISRVFDDVSIDAVMHFASHSRVGESVVLPFMYLGDNVVNAVNLLRAATEHDVRRFVLSSTAALFGEPERVPIDEQVSIVPGNPYGESKRIIERVLYWLERTVGLRYAALRYFNAAGASARCGECHNPETHLIPLVLQVALGLRDGVQVFGTDYPTPDGTCIRDYIHVVDLAQAHIRALDALDAGSCAYNLGNGSGYSVLEVIDTARLVTGHPIPVIMAPRRRGDPPVLVASSELIRRELGWQPQYPSLRDVIQSAWDWHRGHPRGYEG